MVKVITDKMNNYHRILTSQSQNHFSAILYYESFDEDGSLSMEFLRSITMDKSGCLQTHRSDGLVMLSDINDLNMALVSTIREAFVQKGHWLVHDQNFLHAEASYQLDVFGFFIAHPHFGSFEWYYIKDFIESIPTTLCNRFVHEKDFPQFINFVSGKHASKSVRKALFKNFNESVEKKGSYNPHSDLIICRSFEDPNIVCHFLSLPIREEMLKGIEITQCIQFFKWLQTQYSASSIVRSISHSVDYCGNFFTPRWVNTMRMVVTLYNEYPYAIERNFQKVPMNSKRFHDELIRIQSHMVISTEKNVTYHYTKQEYAMEMRIQDLSFILVKDKLQLNEWGGILHNCLYGFDGTIQKKWSYIIGVFRKNELTYAVEIDGKIIRQAYGKYNSLIPDQDNHIVVEWVRLAREILKIDVQTLEMIA